MIPNTRPYYMRESGQEVAAWDEDGYPLVVDLKRGRLTRATGAIDFDPDHIVSIIPAPGWIVRHKSPEDQFDAALVGWALTTSGEVAALDTDSYGMVTPVSACSDRGDGREVTIWHESELARYRDQENHR